MSNKLLLKGMGVSAGRATGIARLISSADDYQNVLEGDILVTHLTDPSMTIILNKCSAIVCDIGGMTSHPAIIAREMGIPAVVGTNIATKTIKDGMNLVVDGTTGEIFIEE